MAQPAYRPVGPFRAAYLGITALLALGLASTDAAAQSRVDFHLLPAVSTGPLDPAWSPDGTRLAFAMRGDIWIIDAAGGTARALTAGDVYYSEPAFSPDGRRIALTVDRGGNLDIGIVDAAGGDVRVLVDGAEDDFAPAWSRDGETLYFVTRRAGNLDIHRLDLATGDTRAVIDGPGHQYQPAESPDGQSLAFVGPVDGGIGSGGIWLMPLSGGTERLVHYEESSYRLKPHWSADGASLFFISDARGDNNIARVPAAGGNRVWITEDAADEFDAAPAPDGRRMAFVSNEGGTTTLHLVDAAGGPRPQWTDLDLSQREARTAMGRITGRILDADGDALPARLMLTASDGRAYTQDGRFHRIVPATRTHYQHSDGHFAIDVPAGPARIAAMRGFEFHPASAEVDVPAGGSVRVDLRLEALTDPRAKGWYSGDMHVHDLHEGRFGLTREDFFAQLKADDLGVANALIHMDGTKLMGRWSDLTGSDSPLSDERTILRYSQEFRGYFGHFALVGVDRFHMPLIGGVPHTPFAADTLGLGHIDAARAGGAIAGFVHPFNQDTDTPQKVGKRDLPVLAALGRGDFYDVVSIASREPESAAVYYRLLNAGIRLAATGGTDNFSDVWYDPSGGTARTYARLAAGERLSFDAWIDAVRAGRTFATNGPLLFLKVEGHEPGATVELAGAGDTRREQSVEVIVDVRSIAALDDIELVMNGEVVMTWPWTPGETATTLRTRLPVDGPAWLSARASGPASPWVGDARAFAQTSPVYLEKDGDTYRSAEDAAFLASAVTETWRLAEARDSWATPAEKAAYRRGIDDALAYYRRAALTNPDDPAFEVRAPDSFTVHLETSRGDIRVALERELSPRGVDRFYNLVRLGYYDDMRVHRIRAGDFVQFGINGQSSIARAWRDAAIADEPVRASNIRGTLAFAHGEAPDDRTTQVFINLRDKPELDAMGFSVMGRVVEGMDVADALYADYGERAGGGIRGGRQDPIFEGGNAYLDENFPRLDRILRARIER